MANFLIGKDDDYWISEVIFRRKEIVLLPRTWKKKYVMDILYLKWVDEYKFIYVPCSRWLMEKNLILFFFFKEIAHPATAFTFACSCLFFLELLPLHFFWQLSVSALASSVDWIQMTHSISGCKETIPARASYPFYDRDRFRQGTNGTCRREHLLIIALSAPICPLVSVLSLLKCLRLLFYKRFRPLLIKAALTAGSLNLSDSIAVYFSHAKSK